MNETSMRIGEVAHQAGVRASLIRYYEDIELLPEPGRVSGQRRYNSSVLRRLAVIDTAQRAGLSLDEIRELLRAGNAPISISCENWRSADCPRSKPSSIAPSAVRAWLQAANRLRLPRH